MSAQVWAVQVCLQSDNFPPGEACTRTRRSSFRDSYEGLEAQHVHKQRQHESRVRSGKNV